jgi:hypothetical protein
MFGRVVFGQTHVAIAGRKVRFEHDWVMSAVLSVLFLVLGFVALQVEFAIHERSGHYAWGLGLRGVVFPLMCLLAVAFAGARHVLGRRLELDFENRVARVRHGLRVVHVQPLAAVTFERRETISGPMRLPSCELFADVSGRSMRIAEVANDYAPELETLARLLTRATGNGSWERTDTLRLRSLSKDCDT